MSEVTHNADAPLKEKPFPGDPGKGEPVNPRVEAIDAMSEKFERIRVEELHEAMDADPGLKANQEAIERGMAEANAANTANLTDEQAAAAVAAEAEANDGAASRAPLNDPPVSTEKPALPKELQDDPLAEFVEMVDGRPMLKMKVDGKIVLRDLHDVRVTEQKHEAADRRLQYASEWQKDLQQRETVLKEKEIAPVPQSQQTSPLPEKADVDDLDIEAVSRDIVSSMFTGTEEEAASKLADTLRRVKGPGVQPQPLIDADALVDKAKKAARAEMEQDHYKSNVTTAWNTFTEDFKDVMDDDEAFAFADSLTGKLEKEHPDWTPREVMIEAGSRARAVVVEGKKPPKTEDPPLPPADADRQAKKENLTPIPQHGNATQETPEDEKPQSATEVLAEIRQARNQPT